MEKAVRKWYVLCDTTRVNAKKRAYKMLKDKGFKVFSPMKRVEETWGTRRVMVERPIIPDLLIVYTTEESLSPYISVNGKLHYRIIRGSGGRKMTVKNSEMKLFMRATSAASSIDYYKPEEYDSNKIGKSITIRGGAFDGEKGLLLSVNGALKKRLVIRLSNFFVAVIELKETEKQ